MAIRTYFEQFAGSVMDPERNPLRHFHKAQRFQTMLVLSVMWSTIFCAAFGAWYLYGQLVVGHALVILGAFMTGLTFQRPSLQAKTYRD